MYVYIYDLQKFLKKLNHTIISSLDLWMMQITWFMGKKSFGLLVAAIVGCVQDIGEYEDTRHPCNVTDKKVKSASHELLII